MLGEMAGGGGLRNGLPMKNFCIRHWVTSVEARVREGAAVQDAMKKLASIFLRKYSERRIHCARILELREMILSAPSHFSRSMVRSVLVEEVRKYHCLCFFDTFERFELLVMRSSFVF